MKRTTKQTLGAGLLLGSLLTGVFLYKRSKQPGMSKGLAGFTPKQIRHARIVRQMAKRQGIDLKPKPKVVEKVLPNGMTQSYAKKYVEWLRTRVKHPTYKHISPSSLALPVDEAVR